MKIVVCIKRVPSTETNVKIGSDNKSLDPIGVEYIMSPFDEIALEEALRIKEKVSESEVTILTLGPKEASTTCRTGLAMGADKAVLLKDDQASQRDPFAVASALAAELKTLNPDIIFFGKQAVDNDNNQVGAMAAHLLKLPFLSLIIKLELAEKKVTVHREVDGGHEISEVDLPAVFSAQKGLNEPRYPALKGIMAAKKKPLEEKTPQLPDATLETVKMEYPPSRPPGKIVGEGVEAIPELVRLLKEEAKVI